jgi:hypothetical protein
VYFENLPLKDAAFALAASLMTVVISASDLSSSSVSSIYFLVASSEASEISCW